MLGQTHNPKCIPFLKVAPGSCCGSSRLPLNFLSLQVRDFQLKSMTEPGKELFLPSPNLRNQRSNLRS